MSEFYSEVLLLGSGLLVRSWGSHRLFLDQVI